MKTNLGKFAETAAAWYLRMRGYVILSRNYHSRFGEIDIIAKKRGVITFVEVKARGENMLASPAYAVDAYKQSRIIKTAYYYLSHTQNPDCDVSFDVIEVIKNGNHYKFNHIKNAFEIG